MKYKKPYQIRWNNADRASFKATESRKYVSWFEAARKWVEILGRQESEYWAQLEPGKPISESLFDLGGWFH